MNIQIWHSYIYSGSIVLKSRLISNCKYHFCFQGKDYPFTSSEYIVPVKTSGGIMCLSAFTPQDIKSKQGLLWVLGDVFHSVYYTVYDFGNNRVGFAEAI